MTDQYDDETDFRVSGHLNIILLIPVSPAAFDWCNEHLPADAPRHGNGYGIDRRYYEAIYNGIIEDGLTIS